MEQRIAVTDRASLPIISRQRVDKAEMLLNATENELVSYRTGISPEKAVGDSMSYLLAQDIGAQKEIIYAIIERLLAGLALSLNVGKNIEPFQLKPLAIKIYARYYFLSFDELMYVFDKGSSGEYGKLYDRVDEEIIFTWIQCYDVNERQSTARMLVEQEEAKQKTSPQEYEILEKLYAKSIEETEEEKKKKENYQKFREQYFKTKPNPE
jgi:hypothetical protein